MVIPGKTRSGPDSAAQPEKPEQAPAEDGNIRRIAGAATATLEAVKVLEEKWRVLRECVLARIEAIEREFGSGTHHPYGESMLALDEYVGGLRIELEEMEAARKRDIEETKTRRVEDATSADESGDILKLLTRLKEVWPGVPLTEEEAMRGAIRHFERAIQTDPRMGSPRDVLLRGFPGIGPVRALRGFRQRACAGWWHL